MNTSLISPDTSRHSRAARLLLLGMLILPQAGHGAAPGSSSATDWASIRQQVYLKASNNDGIDLNGNPDLFGLSVAVSGDTVVVGAPSEDSNATGVNGDQNNNTGLMAGAAYIFVRTGTTWTQQAYLKGSNTEGGSHFFVGEGDRFGLSVAVSGDTVVVGAVNESSNATGVNGDQSNNRATNSGAVYVFVRHGTHWTQQAYLKASNPGGGIPDPSIPFSVLPGTADEFGYSVAVSGDTIVVGAPWEDSSATGINGDQNDNRATDSGAAYIFTRNGTNWSQQAYLKTSNAGADDQFGVSVAVSGDTVVVGAWGEDSNATGVNGNQGDNSAEFAGAAYVFVRNGASWTQQAYLKASHTRPLDAFFNNAGFGNAVAVSGDIVVVGAPYESSNATGVNGQQTNDLAFASGAAYVFSRNGTNWTQQAYLKASNTGGGSAGEWGDTFGWSVAVSGDTVLVGAYGEDSNATGINGNQSNNSGFDSGAAYVFTAPAIVPPELRLTVVRIGDLLQLTATSTANTQWRLEFRDTLTGTNTWQPLTNITVSTSPVIVPCPLEGTNRFYRGAWVP